jgi:alpha-D-ribose 1-methylphosphonate 5-triphosphate synthase subunit PhnH
LAEFVPLFLKGAYIVYAHSVLQRHCGLGITSQWAKNNFASVEEKNEFFRKLGESLEPGRENTLSDFNDRSKPGRILAKIKP